MLLGGEAAAAVVTDAIRPATAVLHVAPGDQQAAMKALQLVPRPDGAITLVHTFGTTNQWTVPLRANIPLADPLLIHAELLRAGGDRDKAVADEIYAKHIAGRLENAQ
jgi:hypothetical protein